MTTQKSGKKEMLLGLDLHTIVRSACVGQLASVPLSLLAGALSNTPLYIVGAAVTNPIFAAVFAGLGVAAYKFYKTTKDEFQAETAETRKSTEKVAVPPSNVISIHYGKSVKSAKNRKSRKRV